MRINKANLWFGGRGGANIYTHNPDNIGLDTFLHYTKKQGLDNRAILSILEDRRGDFWLGTSVGVIRYSPQSDDWPQSSFTFYGLKEGLSGNQINSICEDNFGHIWFGTWGGGISRFSPDPDVRGQGTFTHFTLENGLSSNTILSITKDSRSNLWLRTLESGISLYIPHPDNPNQGTFTHLTTNEGLLDNAVKTILEDSKSNIWFGTKSGLSLFNAGEKGDNWQNNFTNFTNEGILTGTPISSIVEDKKKNLWVSTQDGITLIRPYTEKDIANNYHSLKDKFQYFNFGMGDGLKRLDFVNQAHLDRNNFMWWSSFDGLTKLDLNRFQLTGKAPSVVLDHIKIAQQGIDFRRLNDPSYSDSFSFGKDLMEAFDSIAPFYNYPIHLNLPHYLNDLTFHISGIDWAAPHKIRYSFIMEGFEEEWSVPNKDNKVNYRNLPFGSYTFKVKAIGEGQVWSEVFEYPFRILPPWWKTFWAYALYLFLIVGVLYYVYRFELKRQLSLAENHRLKEMDAFKTKLFTDISHELRTPLTIILGMASQIQQDPRRWVDEGVEMISRNGHNLLKLVNQILDLRKLETGGPVSGYDSG